mmetsp:Transcript_78244/g.172667  ORF Transcript_78244/g.172667 Transcript_78244/m.172667 type:complete len:91 (+) Transcript_78244:100-372(+)
MRGMGSCKPISCELGHFMAAAPKAIAKVLWSCASEHPSYDNSLVVRRWRHKASGDLPASLSAASCQRTFLNAVMTFRFSPLRRLDTLHAS